MFIDWKKVDSLLQAQVSGIQIAATLGVAHDTLYKACVRDNKMTFSEYSQLKREHGKALLIAAQFKRAMAGDNTMLIWLGKQYLNQTDKAKNEITESSSVQIEIVNPSEDGKAT